jgi:hypothetical protein
MTCPMNLSLAEYALGVLTGVEREQLVSHLPSCAECRDELAGMAGVVGLLHQLTLHDRPAPPDHQATTAPIVPERGPAAATRRSRPRRRWATAAAGGIAALVVVLVVGVGAHELGTARRSSEATTSATSWTTHDPASGVTATATLARQQWGTALRLRMANVPARLECRLVVARPDGRQQVIGTWRTGYLGTVTVPAATALRTSDIQAIDVVTSGGDRLVHLGPEQADDSRG